MRLHLVGLDLDAIRPLFANYLELSAIARSVAMSGDDAELPVQIGLPLTLAFDGSG